VNLHAELVETPNEADGRPIRGDENRRGTWGRLLVPVTRRGETTIHAGGVTEQPGGMRCESLFGEGTDMPLETVR
jgi:hypothetical protein